MLQHGEWSMNVHKTEPVNTHTNILQHWHIISIDIPLGFFFFIYSRFHLKSYRRLNQQTQAEEKKSYSMQKCSIDLWATEQLVYSSFVRFLSGINLLVESFALCCLFFWVNWNMKYWPKCDKREDATTEWTINDRKKINSLANKTKKAK